MTDKNTICNDCEILLRDLYSDDVVNSSNWAAGPKESGGRLGLYEFLPPRLSTFQGICTVCEYICNRDHRAPVHSTGPAMLWSEISKSEASSVWQNTRFKLRFMCLVTHGSGSIRECFIRLYSGSMHLNTFQVLLYTADLGHKMMTDRPGSSPFMFPITPALSYIRHWMSDQLSSCNDTSHAKFHRSSANADFESSSERVPRRLLDLGSDDMPKVSICTPSSLPIESYVTLSHCWGGTLPCRTLKSNLEDRQKSMELDGLPILFREAVSICRMMNVKFLWIDALCIVQDDPDYWADQAEIMADIYRNAIFTLACHRASHSYQSILGPRRAPGAFLVMPRDITQGRLAHFSICNTEKGSRDELLAVFNGGPLNKRA